LARPKASISGESSTSGQGKAVDVKKKKKMLDDDDDSTFIAKKLTRN
jgi:hypothetical protein